MGSQLSVFMQRRCEAHRNNSELRSGRLMPRDLELIVNGRRMYYNELRVALRRQ